MKEFLFSRSHKKHYSCAVVRMGKNNLGFSLVELIIVIAIMAILAAIAIPVLGVFIEKAEINNDKQMVTDIIYAIDLANKSGSFTNDNSMTLGTTKYPVAFIVINEEGTTVLTSNTTVNEVAGQCAFEDVTVYYAKPQSTTITCNTVYKNFIGQTKTCSNTISSNVYTIETITLNICTVHSTKSSTSSTYPASIKAKHGTFSCSAETAASTEPIPTGSYVVTSLSDYDSQGLYQQSSNGKCAMAAYGTLGTPSASTDDVNNAVYQAIAAVYGSSFTTDLKLSYAEWVADGNFNYSTFYSSAPSVFEDVQDLGDMLVGALDAASLGGLTPGLADEAANKLGLAKTYDSTADLMDTFSAAFSAMYPTYSVDGSTTDWESIWASTPDKGYSDWGFGFKSPYNNRENYSACRMGFNVAFASYLEARGEIAYAAKIKDYYTNELLGVKLPGTVTKSAFKNGTNWDTAKDEATTVPDDATTLGAQLGSVEAINDVWKYYKEYINSDTFIENGKAFYETVKTVDETSTTANIYANGDDDKYYEFYQTYLNEISNLYTQAQTLAGSDGIMIIVYVENGVATCEVTPAAADPRNK